MKITREGDYVVMRTKIGEHAGLVKMFKEAGTAIADGRIEGNKPELRMSASQVCFDVARDIERAAG